MKNYIILFTLLYFIMFVYSGVDKIFSYKNKINTLSSKLKDLPSSVINIGMISVILLEIFGPIIIISRIIMGNNAPEFLKKLSNIVFILFILFLIVVTIIYHPPNDKIIPFLSNCTTLAGLLLLYIISNSELINN